MADTATPTTRDPKDHEDVRHDDLEFNPALEPKKAQAWLNLLEESEKAFEKWNERCDNIEKLYANLEKLASMARDKEFQMFWANCEVIKPSILAKAPRPAVVTKFKDRRPVPQAAAEMLERVDTVAFDITNVEALMKQVRDDLVLTNRGVAWCRYETASKSGSYYNTEKVCIEFKQRRDFLHSISRSWYEVTWVAAASYLTRTEARERFKQYSGDEYQRAEYTVDREAKAVGGADNRERGKFWEIWDKTNRRVVWVAKGCEDILDEDDPHLDLSNYFPAPCPAYGSLQAGSLVPVPDVLQYKDQLDELNLLTAKIHALSNALEAKGFYPAGGGELGDAIQAAVANSTPGRLLVPISNWAAFGGSKEVIVWLPMAEIAQTISSLVELRKEVIQDIYQIMGLSDIMRGATDARETLGAQELKSQFGSTRVRGKQEELVRLARDLVCITSEIITENFDEVTLIEMSQTQLPTAEMQRKQVMQITQQLDQQQQQITQVQQSPEFQQAQQANPDAVAQAMDQAQKLIQSGHDAIGKIMRKPNVEQVFKFLRDNRSRAFVLDIEIDSTIMIDENTEKQRRAEFTGVLAQLLPQISQMIMAKPETAEFCGELLKFATAPFRAGRALEGAIDGLVDLMTQQIGQPKGDDPTTAQNKAAIQIEQIKDATAKEKIKAEADTEAAKLKQADDHKKMELANQRTIEQMKLNAAGQDDQARAQQTNLKGMLDREKHQQDMIKVDAGIEQSRAKLDMQRESQTLKHNDMMAKANERRAMQQFKMTQPQKPLGGPPA